MIKGIEFNDLRIQKLLCIGLNIQELLCNITIFIFKNSLKLTNSETITQCDSDIQKNVIVIQ